MERTPRDFHPRTDRARYISCVRGERLHTESGCAWRAPPSPRPPVQLPHGVFPSHAATALNSWRLQLHLSVVNCSYACTRSKQACGAGCGGVGGRGMGRQMAPGRWLYMGAHGAWVRAGPWKLGRRPRRPVERAHTYNLDPSRLK
jgi:hypothetical protein